MTANSPVPGETDEVSRWMFFRSLKASKLLSADQIDALERRAAVGSFDDFQKMLVDASVLTPYQLKRVLDGNGQKLVLGQYRILSELGQGGCGQVYLARHALMDRLVALKVVAQDLNPSQYARDMFRREVVASTRLSHPNIAAAYHADECDGQIFFVMEYVCGPTLQSLIESDGPVSVSLACTILHETAQALQHAHENGTVHRDIKPANIMLPGTRPSPPCGSRSNLSKVKVVDFGLARIRGGNNGTDHTIQCREGALVGTPAYMAPEQITDVHRVDIRSDLYSLGCTMYHALVGRPPFCGASTQITLYLHAEEEPVPMLELRPHLPPRLTAIVHRLMAKDPAARFQTPDDLLETVHDFILSCDTSEAPLRPPTNRWPEPTPATDSCVDVVNPGCSRTGLKVAHDVAPVAHDVRTVAHDIVPIIPLVSPSGATPLAAAEATQDLWDDWSFLIESVHNGRTVGYTAEEYGELHRDLLRSIRSSADGEPSRSECFRRSEGVVEPWVTLDSLLKLNRDTLECLWHDVRAAHSDLWPTQRATPDNWIGRLVTRMFR